MTDNVVQLDAFREERDWAASIDILVAQGATRDEANWTVEDFRKRWERLAREPRIGVTLGPSMTRAQVQVELQRAFSAAMEVVLRELFTMERELYVAGQHDQ
jgi:hypothetical protein